MVVTQPPYYAEQRRWATVLVTNVSGTSYLSERKETVSDLIRVVWERVEGVLMKYGGYIEKVTGEGLVAVWGAPYGAENDAERAVSAGLAVLDEVASFNDTHRGSLLDKVELRIGIDTGPVLAGYVGSSDSYLVIGDTVDIAKHLEQVGQPGKVIMSESTYQFVRSQFKVQSFGEIDLEVKHSKIIAYRVDKKKQNTSKVLYHSEEILNTRMVAREYETEKLSTLFHRSMCLFKPVLVLILGDPGIGKSRLMMEFVNNLDDSEGNLSILSTRALEQTSRDSFFLWKSLWQNRFDITDDDLPKRAKEKFEIGIRELWDMKFDGRSPTEAVHRIGNLMGFTWSASKYLTPEKNQPDIRANKAFSLTRDLFKRASIRGPIVLLFDDLHWADHLSLELLEDLLKPDTEPLPLFVVAAARKEFLQKKPRWANFGEIISLKPLPVKGEIIRMAYPDLQYLADEIMMEIAIRSDGNPYFMEEMVKEMVKSEIGKPGSDAELLKNQLNTRIPDTLQSMLQARLDSLPQEARLVALLSSVVGRVFWVGPVLAAARSASHTGTGLLKLGPFMVERVVQNGLRKLVQAEMAFPRAKTQFSEDQEYIFKHSILRDVAYSLIPCKYLPQYHLAVARNLVVRADSKFKVMAADHFEKAGAFLEASRQYEFASWEASSRGANEEAQWLIGKAQTLKEAYTLKSRF